MRHFFILLLLFASPLNANDGAVDKTMEVGEQAVALERLLEGLKDGKHLDVAAKKKVLVLLKELRSRDIGLDVDTIIEDLEADDPEAAGDTARALLMFLQKMRKVVAEEQQPKDDPDPVGDLDSILQDQKKISRELEELLAELDNPAIDRVNDMARRADELDKLKAAQDAEQEGVDELKKAMKAGDMQKVRDFTGSKDDTTAKERLDKMANRLEQESTARKERQDKLAAEIQEMKQKSGSEDSGLDKEDRKELDRAANELKDNRPGKAAQKLKELASKMAGKQIEKMTPEQKQTIEHLKTKQEELAARLQQKQEAAASEDEKKKIHEAVDQMARLVNKFEKGELDSGLWESKEIEETLEELIKKIQFDQNKYAMDQKLVKMSDFIKFAEELQLKQTDLHSLWKGVDAPGPELFKTSTEKQTEIHGFSRSKDRELAESQSLAFTYGLRRIQVALADNIDLLAKSSLPSVEVRSRIERDIQELIDGLKKLRGRLAEEQNRPDKRDSHDGQDSEHPAVSLIEEMRYLRLLQMHLNERRLADPENKDLDTEQKEIHDMLLQLRAKWIKKKESRS